MPKLLLALALTVGVTWTLTPGDQRRNVWEQQYKDRTAADMAAQFESDRRPVYRHRRDIVALLDLSPGQTLAEVGAGSGFLSRLASREVGAAGRVIATELDAKMVDYMNARAEAEGLANVRAVLATPDDAGLDRGSMDAVLIVNTYSFFDRPRAMMSSVARAMKPGALLVIVDFPAGQGRGVDPASVIQTAEAAGFAFVDRRSVVPSHFALRFRKR